MPFYNSVAEGFKRIYEIAHRRWGKDKVAINLTAKETFKRKGLYLYMYPEYKQARKAIWDGMDGAGFKYMDHFPQEIREKTNDQEMRLKLKNGSIFQVAGSDNYDSFRSTNPVGVVFSEFAYHDPRAWATIQPILIENDGWAAFITTFNGKNHAANIAEYAKGHKDWFFNISSVLDTGAISIEKIEEHRAQLIAEGMSKEEADAFINQEYYCSLNAFVLGAYYTAQLAQAEAEERITNVPRESNAQVEVFFDLGKNDSTTMIFLQSLGKEIHLIDCHDASGKEIEYFCRVLDEKKYRYGYLNLPHDATFKLLASPKTVQQQFEDAGFKTRIVPKLEIQDGIQQVRAIFPKVWIDKTKCEPLIEALRNYHKEYDEKAKVFKNQPKHDWSSHYADAMRYLAVGYMEEKKKDFEPVPINPVFTLDKDMNSIWG